MSLRDLQGPLFVAAALVSGCGSSPAPSPAPLTAEQLALTARPGLEDDSLGPPRARVEAPMPPPAPEPPPTASLRVIHASPDRAAASVDVYAGSNGTAVASALAFRRAAGPVTLPVGEQPVALRAAGAAADSAPVVSLTTPALDASRTYTAIAHGLVGNAQNPLGVAAALDDETAPDEGQARARLFHAVAGLGAVDVCTAAVPARAGQPAQPARALFANAGYGAFTDYVAIPAGAAVTVQLRARAARPCAGPVRGTVSLTPAAGVMTLVATGRVAVGANNVSRVLLVCPQGGEGASCTEAPVR